MSTLPHSECSIKFYPEMKTNLLKKKKTLQIRVQFQRIALNGNH